MTRRLPAILSAVACCALFHAGPLAARRDDPCGNAATVNQSYDVLFGKVVAVDSGDTIVVVFEKGSAIYDDAPAGSLMERSLAGVSTTVRLVAIEAPGLDQPVGQRSRAALEKRVLGNRMEVCPSPYQSAGTPLNALVSEIGDGVAETNLQQVKDGFARQVEQGDYDIDWYLRCTFERAEESAKQHNRGMWSARQAAQP
jgi:endonuclease YncB( thermonuclease family)